MTEDKMRDAEEMREAKASLLSKYRPIGIPALVGALSSSGKSKAPPSGRDRAGPGFDADEDPEGDVNRPRHRGFSTFY